VKKDGIIIIGVAGSIHISHLLRKKSSKDQ
jgi:hypothetical protein